MKALISTVAVFTFATPAFAGTVQQGDNQANSLKSSSGATVCRSEPSLARAQPGSHSVNPSQLDDKAMKIAAVVRMINGCAVLVMADDLRDMRPVPDLRDAKPKMQGLQ